MTRARRRASSFSRPLDSSGVSSAAAGIGTVISSPGAVLVLVWSIGRRNVSVEFFAVEANHAVPAPLFGHIERVIGGANEGVGILNARVRPRRDSKARR